MRLLSLGLLLAAIGCQSPVGPQICDRPESPEPRDYREGFCDGDTYMTTSWSGDLLYFPKGAYYRIHHDFGAIPTDVTCYLSFKRHGNGDGGDGEQAAIAEAAGNQCQIQRVTETYVDVLNGTCAEFWMMLTVRAGGKACASPPDGTGGAGGAGGAGTGGIGGDGGMASAMGSNR